MTLSNFDDRPGVIVVADDPIAVAAAESAVLHAQARLLAVVTWAEVLARAANQSTPAAWLIETAGVPEDIVARVLPDLVEVVGAASIVVAFAHDRIEDVGTPLIGSEAALLCEASQGDRVAALVMTLHGEAVHVQDSREEAARMARINAEVARFTETLSRLTDAAQGSRAADERQTIVGDRRTEFAMPGDDAIVTAGEVRRAIRSRRLRDEVFGAPGLFEDPAWDMLLDLFAADLERRQVSVSSLCIAAAVAPTTALRWISKLIAVGLFERRPDAFDRRRAFIALTPRAMTAIRGYMAALRRVGLSIA